MQIAPTYLRHLQSWINQNSAVSRPFAELVQQLAKAAVADRNEVMSRLFSLVGGQPGMQELGFLAGLSIPMSAYGNVMTGVRAAPDVRCALLLAAEGHELELPLVRYRYERDESGAIFHIGFRHPMDAPGEAWMVSAAAAVTIKAIRAMTGRSQIDAEIRLTNSSESLAQAYRRHLGVDPIFGYQTNGLRFGDAVLNLSNQEADPVTFDECREACRWALEKARCETTVSQQVAELLSTNLAETPELSTVAESLHLSARQLRFALKKEGTGYREISQHLRLTQAQRLLDSTHIQISEVAYRLGFSDVAAFSHGFLRWTGQTPSQYRQQRG